MYISSRRVTISQTFSFQAFAFLSFLLSIAAIYTIATEVVNVLEVRYG